MYSRGYALRDSSFRRYGWRLRGNVSRVESSRVGREKARIEPNAAQGGAILRKARHTRISLRTGRQEAAHLQWLLGGHYRHAPHKGLVGPLARSQCRRSYGGEKRSAGPGHRPEGWRSGEPGRPRPRGLVGGLPLFTEL